MAAQTQLNMQVVTPFPNACESLSDDTSSQEDLSLSNPLKIMEPNSKTQYSHYNPPSNDGSPLKQNDNPSFRKFKKSSCKIILLLKD